MKVTIIHEVILDVKDKDEAQQAMHLMADHCTNAAKAVGGNNGRLYWKRFRIKKLKAVAANPAD